MIGQLHIHHLLHYLQGDVLQIYSLLVNQRVKTPMVVWEGTENIERRADLPVLTLIWLERVAKPRPFFQLYLALISALDELDLPLVLVVSLFLADVPIERIEAVRRDELFIVVRLIITDYCCCSSFWSQRDWRYCLQWTQYNSCSGPPPVSVSLATLSRTQDNSLLLCACLKSSWQYGR